MGLIGSSIARATRERNLAKKIIGCDQNEISLAFAKKHGFIDSGAADMAEAVKGSDLVIIATPPATLGAVSKAIAPALTDGAIVMDTASVKRPAITEIKPHLPENVFFIPAHPIAGSEESGVQAGRADLFAGKRVIITPEAPPVEGTESGNALKKAIEFWHFIGAKVEGMPAETHDLLYCYMSHLPQLIAFCLKEPLGEFIGQAPDKETYQSFIRLTRSNPELWAEIFSDNSDNLQKAVDRYIDVINHVWNELKTAPDGEEEKRDALLAHTVLFPRIVASCLVTTVMEAEKNAGFPFARYAGTGFADLTLPAIEKPEEEIEQISAQYKLVAEIIGKFLNSLKAFRKAL